MSINRHEPDHDCLTSVKECRNPKSRNEALSQWHDQAMLPVCWNNPCPTNPAPLTMMILDDESHSVSPMQTTFYFIPFMPN